MMSPSAKALDARSDSSTSIREFLVKLDLCAGSIVSSELEYDDENSAISTILRNLTKTIYFWREMCYNIYVNKKERS